MVWQCRRQSLLHFSDNNINMPKKFEEAIKWIVLNYYFAICLIKYNDQPKYCSVALKSSALTFYLLQRQFSSTLELFLRCVCLYLETVLRRFIETKFECVCVWLTWHFVIDFGRCGWRHWFLETSILHLRVRGRKMIQFTDILPLLLLVLANRLDCIVYCLMVSVIAMRSTVYTLL